MNKLIFFTITVLQYNYSFCQEQVRDKVSLMVNYLSDGCNVSQSTKDAAAAAIYALNVTYLEKNKLFQVVNRESTEFSVSKLGLFSEKFGTISNNFWVDYTNKLKEKSKGIGAKSLIIIDQIALKENGELMYFYRYKIINVETNALFTFSFKIDNIGNENMSVDKYRETMRKSIVELKEKLNPKIDESWNTSFKLINIDGKKITAQPYSVCPLNIGMNLYWFKWTEHKVGEDFFYEVDRLGLSEVNSINSNAINLTSENKFNGNDLNQIWGQLTENFILKNSAYEDLSVIEFKQNEETTNTYITYDLNTKLYEAIKLDNQFQLFQAEENDLVYEEKNLQKSEEFLYGSSVKQTKSIKSKYLLLCSDLGSTKDKYHVEFKIIDKMTGSITKSSVIECSAKEYVNKTIDFLSSTLLHKCRIMKIDSKKINVFSLAKFYPNTEKEYEIFELRKMVLNGKEQSIRVPVAKVKLTEVLGQKLTFKITEVLDSKFNNISPSETYYFGIAS